MEEKVVITEDEWLSELSRYEEVEEGQGKTAAEIAEATGKSKEYVRKSLNKSIKRGTIRVVMGYRAGIDGKRQYVPLYSLVKTDVSKSS